MMKVYLATKYEDGDRMRQFAARMVAKGYTITLPWWDVVESNLTPAENARNDLDAVKAADCLIAFMDKDFDYKGTYVEIGAALALGHRVFMVQPNNRAQRCVFPKRLSIHRRPPYVCIWPTR